MPFKSKGRRVFVFVGDDQVAVSPHEVAEKVMGEGFRAAAAYYHVAETTLRVFLVENKIAVKRRSVWQIETLPIEEGVGNGSADATADTGDQNLTGGA